MRVDDVHDEGIQLEYIPVSVERVDESTSLILRRVHHMSPYRMRIVDINLFATGIRKNSCLN